MKGTSFAHDLKNLKVQFGLQGYTLGTLRNNQHKESAVAEPRFPQGEGPNSPGEGCQHIILPNFPKNCMQVKEFGPGEGEGSVQNFTM